MIEFGGVIYLSIPFISRRFLLLVYRVDAMIEIRITNIQNAAAVR